MEFNQIQGALTELSLQDVFIGDTQALLSVVYFAVMISIYSLAIWHFYRFLAQRDCFHYHHEKHPRLMNTLKYMFCFPFIAFIFFLGLSLMLLFISKDYEITVLLSTAFALVAAVRIICYYSEDLSRDISKMLPLAILAMFVVDPAYFSMADITSKIMSIPLFFTLCLKYIFYIVVMEWVLRVFLHVRIRIRPTTHQVPHSPIQSNQASGLHS